MDPVQADLPLPPLPDEEDRDFLEEKATATSDASSSSSSSAGSSAHSDRATMGPGPSSPRLTPVPPPPAPLSTTWAEASEDLNTLPGGFALGQHICDGGHGGTYYGEINGHECVLKVVSERAFLLLCHSPSNPLHL